jgi:hypothetical protein
MVIGNRFKLVETGHIICLVSLNKRDSSLTFKYEDSEKPDFQTNEKEVKRMVGFKMWVLI